MVRKLDLLHFVFRAFFGIALSMLVTACPSQVSGGGAGSTNGGSSTVLWGTSRDNAVATYTGKVKLGNILQFKKVDNKYFKDATLGALLEVEFQDGGVFGLNSFSVALNGISGGSDFSRVSSWEIDGGKKKLYVGLAGLSGTDGTSFDENAFYILTSNGTLTVWLTAPRTAVAARLIFYPKAPTIPPKDPTVVLDQSPTATSVGNSAVFAFHSPEGTAAAFECALDTSNWTPCASPIVYSNLSAGLHKFAVHALDAKGKKYGDTKYEFTLQAVVSAVKITKVDPATSPTSANTLTVTFSVSTVNLNVPVVGTSGFCQLDGGQVTPCSSPVKFVGLAEGAHTARISALVTGDNNAATYTWLVDRTAPKLQWLSTPKNVSNVSAPTFTFATSEPAMLTCELDGRVGDCASPVALPNLADGTHTLVVKGTDAAGNASDPLSYVWAVDTAAPTMKLLGAVPSATLTRETALTLSFSASEAASFTCALDGAAATACTSPVAYANLTDGVHRVRVTPTDIAGNVGAALLREWTIDTSIPTLSLVRVTPDRTPTNLRAAQFTFSTNEASTFACATDGAAATACTSPISLSGLGEGAHVFSVVATDAAGNVSAPATTKWTVDITAPRLTLGAATPAESITTSRSLSLEYSLSEDAIVACNLDDAGEQVCGAPFNVNNLADGKHTVVLTATDNAGNVSAPVSYSWEVMSQARVTIASATPAEPQTAKNQIAFEFTSINTQTFVCSLDGQTATPCTSPQSYSGLGDGDHVFSVQGVNVVGVAGTAALYNWNVDTTAPKLTLGEITPPDSLVKTASITIKFTSDEPATFSCTVDDATPTICGSPFTTAALADGKHTFRITGKDIVGNVSAPLTYGWSSDTVAPQVTLGTVSPAKSPSNLRELTVPFSIDDVAATALCTLDTASETPCTSPAKFSGLIDGKHHFALRARDAAGNSSALATYDWSIDTAAPKVKILAQMPAVSPTNSRKMTVEFEADKLGVSFECALDGAAPVACGSPFEATELGDGAHVVAIVGKDGAGNASDAATVAWTIDTVIPVVAITATRPAVPVTNSATMTLDFSATKQVSFFCATDGAAATACASPLTVSALTDGNHTIAIYAKDSAGNQSATVGHAWTVDTKAPTLTLGAVTPAGARVSTTSLSMAFTASKPDATFLCALDTNAAASCTSPFSATVSIDGKHTVTVVATDSAGNQSAPLAYSWTVDTVAPVVAIDSRNPSGAVAKSTALNVAFHADDTDARFFCAVDGAAAAPCAAPYSATVAEGQHTFSLYAKDDVGNQSTAVGFSWTVDTTVPVVTILAKAPVESTTKENILSATFQVSEVATVFCSVDGGAPSLCESTFKTGALGDGAHTITIAAQDSAGNQGAPVSVTWTVDTTAPTVTLGTATPTGALVKQATMSLAFTANEAGATFRCALDGKATNCTSPLSVANLVDGTHTITVSATDVAGNVGNAVAYTWKVDTTAPTATIVSTNPTGSPTELTTMSIVFAADEAGSTFNCSLDGAAATSCASPYGVAGLASGNHSFAVTARDAAGNIGAAASYAWTIQIAPPRATITSVNPAASLTSSTTLAVAFTADKAATFTCQLDGGAKVACSSPYSFANVANGAHTVSIVATDATGNAGPAASYGWTVDSTAPTVTIGTVNPSQSPTTTTSLNVSFGVSEAATTFCSLDGAAFAQCTSPYAVNGLADSAHTVGIYAVDTAGNRGVTATYNWTVDTTAPVVTITSDTPSYSPTSNTSMTATFTANEAATFACSLDGGSLVSCAASWTVNGLSDGTHTIAIRATDLAGNVGQSSTYTWVVNTQPLAITNVAVSQVTSSTAVVTWTTNVPSTSQLNYGAGSPTTLTGVDGNFVTSHSVTLTGMTANTFMAVQAISQDRDGRKTTSSTVNFRTTR